MIDLYGYDNASYEECIDDLNIIVDILTTLTYTDGYSGDLDTLERKGLRIQYIAQRLQELEE